jgi:hypothetical protein
MQQAIRRPSVDWHWDQPVWPSRMRTADWFTRRFTLWRCARCGIEFMGDAGQEQLDLHMGAHHPGRPAVFTVYPPSVGLRPRGGDA